MPLYETTKKNAPAGQKSTKKVIGTELFIKKKQKIMKKTKIIAFLLLASALAANAQITKGNWMVGGTMNFSSVESTSYSNNVEYKLKGIGLSINPNLGYFITDRFCIGGSIGYNYSNPEGDNNNSSGIGFSPFVRYYFLDTEKTVNVFANAGYGYSSGKTESGNKSHGSGYGISAGPVIYFNNSVGLEMSINYSKSKNNTNSTYSNLYFAVGFQIHLKK